MSDGEPREPGDPFATRDTEFTEAPQPFAAGSAGSVLARVGNYELMQRLGAGAMGEVYLARHTTFEQRLYAVKLIRSELTSQAARERFHREILAMADLAHPNLVFANDAGIEADRWYLVMEYIPGCDAQYLIDHHSPLPVGQAAEILRQVCLGIDHAHSHKIIHRDIKPSNIMVSDRGEVKVLDLGVASLQNEAASRMTEDHSTLGTAAFMAPEQWGGASAASPASDIYSLGCTGYSLLTGRPPFNWDGSLSLPQLMAAHRQANPVPVHERRGGVPEDLSAVILQALAKEPSARLPTAAALAERLAPYCQPLEQKTCAASFPPTHAPASEASPLQGDSDLHWTRNAQQPTPILSRIVISVAVLVLIAGSALTLAYFGPFTTPTWQLRFDRLEEPRTPPGVGYAIELFRVVLYIAATCWVLGTQFTREIRSFFDFRRWSASLALIRFAIVLIIGIFVVSESYRQLSVDEAPRRLAEWGAAHGIETSAAAEASPYRWYLGYSLVNYVVVMGGLFAFPMIRFLFSDLRYIRKQLDAFLQRQSRSTGSGLTKNLFRFGTELRLLTGRYVLVLGTLAVGAHYDYWIGSLTLTEEGQATMMLGMAVAALALIFVLVISLIFFRGFDATNRRIATNGSLAEERELSQISTLWFLKTTVVYNVGGLACLSLLLLFAHAVLG